MGLGRVEPSVRPWGASCFSLFSRTSILTSLKRYYEQPNLIPSLPIATAVQWWFDVLTKHNLSNSDPSILATLKGSCPYVDVRDTARAHVEALKRPEAGGERIIVSGGSVGWVEVSEFASSLLYFYLSSPWTEIANSSILRCSRPGQLARQPSPSQDSHCRSEA